jgi:uncharacterized protein (TIGR00730 family)
MDSHSAARAVTVYCSSSSKIAPAFIDAARALGLAIAQNHWTLVYGGNCIGMMKSLADGCRAGGGRVVGITPQLFIDKGIGDPHCDELILANGMRQRKEMMEQRADAFVALPGGLGTLEEFFEILSARQLGYHDKPIVLLNIERFYDPLLAMIEHGLQHHFIRPRTRQLFHVAETVEDAIQHLLQDPQPKAG